MYAYTFKHTLTVTHTYTQVWRVASRVKGKAAPPPPPGNLVKKFLKTWQGINYSIFVLVLSSMFSEYTINVVLVDSSERVIFLLGMNDEFVNVL